MCREMLVQWTTLDAQKPVARWGTQPGRYDHDVAADTDTYAREASETLKIGCSGLRDGLHVHRNVDVGAD
jgi:hypothetical protein